LDGRVDRKAAKVAEGRKKEGVSEDRFSEGRKPAEGGLKTKEYRSSVGFFVIVRFRVFRGSLDGRVDRKVAKVAEGRKEEGSFLGLKRNAERAGGRGERR
jgi:hypothetical protein